MSRLVSSYWISENDSTNASGAFCHSCGWWVFRGEERIHLMDNNRAHVGDRILQFGQMKRFDLSDLRLPLSVAADAIATDPRVSSNVHPRRFEEIVAYAISSFFSCRVVVTKTTRDGGYDILGLECDRGKFLVEVKRKRLTGERRKVGVSAVRALAGAMIQHNTSHGLLLTNSTFSRDAEAAAEIITSHGWRIDLKDIDDLCDWLGVLRKGHVSSAAFDQSHLEHQVLVFQYYSGGMQMVWDYMKHVPALNQKVIEL